MVLIYMSPVCLDGPVTRSAGLRTNFLYNGYLLKVSMAHKNRATLSWAEKTHASEFSQVNYCIIFLSVCLS